MNKRRLLILMSLVILIGTIALLRQKTPQVPVPVVGDQPPSVLDAPQDQEPKVQAPKTIDAPVELKARVSPELQGRLGIRLLDDSGKMRQLFQVQMDGVDVQNGFLALPKSHEGEMEVSLPKIPPVLPAFPLFDSQNAERLIRDELHATGAELTTIHKSFPRWSFEGHRIYPSWIAHLDFKMSSPTDEQLHFEIWTIDLDKRAVASKQKRNRH